MRCRNISIWATIKLYFIVAQMLSFINIFRSYVSHQWHYSYSLLQLLLYYFIIKLLIVLNWVFSVKKCRFFVFLNMFLLPLTSQYHTQKFHLDHSYLLELKILKKNSAGQGIANLCFCPPRRTHEFKAIKTMVWVK